jgi:tetratricopeptide (TPR) repeat protein
LALADRTDEALAAAREAVRRNDSSARLHSRVAWVLYHGKRYAEAAQGYEDLAARFDAPDATDDVREVVRESRLVLSNIYVLQGELARAEERLEQVLDEFPEDVSALNDLGYLWADQGKHLERALAMVQQALAAEPDNIAYLDSVGWALHKLGRHQEALEPLVKAAAGEKPDGVILEHLGDVHLALGQPAEACAAWRRALESFDAETDAARITAVQEKLARHGPIPVP